MRRHFFAVGIASLCVALFATDVRVRAAEVAERPQPARGQPDARAGQGDRRGAEVMGAFGRGELAATLAILSELNFTPDFTLTKEQKEKIQAIREPYRAKLDAWVAEHDADFRTLQNRRQEMAGLHRDDPATGAKLQEFAKAQQDLFALAPKDDDIVKQIKAVLTEDQLKKFDEQRNRAPGRRPGEGGARAGLQELVTGLARLSLAPDFTLTKEQREKVHAAREEHRVWTNVWRDDHAEELRKIQEQMSAMRNDPNAREKFPEVAKAQQELMATAPKDDDTIKKIKAALTEEQLKTLAAEQAKADGERRMPEMGPRGRFGGVVGAVGELCLTPDFALTKEQKEKIQGIRDQYKAQMDKWREGHQEELKKFQEMMSGMRRDDPGARDQAQEAARAMQELMATAPQDDEFVQEIVSQLTPEQRQQLQARGGRQPGAPGRDEPARPR